MFFHPTHQQQTLRSISLAAAAVAVLMTPLIVAAEIRTWTDIRGRTMQAEFVQFDGETVSLSKDGRVVQLPFTDLSNEDRILVTRLAADQIGKGAALADNSSPPPKKRAKPLELTPLSSQRSWTTRNGQSITGRYVRLHDGAVLIRSQRRVIPIPYQNLSDQDQAFVAEHLKRQGKESLLPRAGPAGKRGLPPRQAPPSLGDAAFGGRRRSDSSMVEMQGSGADTPQGMSAEERAKMEGPMASSGDAGADTTLPGSPEDSANMMTGDSGSETGPIGSPESSAAEMVVPEEYLQDPRQDAHNPSPAAAPTPSSIQGQEQLAANTPRSNTLEPEDADEDEDEPMGRCTICRALMPASEAAGQTHCPRCGEPWDTNEGDKTSFPPLLVGIALLAIGTVLGVVIRKTW